MQRYDKDYIRQKECDSRYNEIFECYTGGLDDVLKPTLSVKEWELKFKRKYEKKEKREKRTAYEKYLRSLGFRILMIDSEGL